MLYSHLGLEVLVGKLELIHEMCEETRVLRHLMQMVACELQQVAPAG